MALPISPLGSIYNPKFPRACFARFAQAQRAVDLVMRALAPVIPDKITAGNSATSKATYAAYLANYKAMRSYIGGRRLPMFNICRQNGTCK